MWEAMHHPSSALECTFLSGSWIYFTDILLSILGIPERLEARLGQYEMYRHWGGPQILWHVYPGDQETMQTLKCTRTSTKSAEWILTETSYV